MERISKIHKWADLTFLVLLGIMLLLPAMDSLLSFDTTPLPVEKRKYAEKPEFAWQWDVLRKYSKQFEAYFNDHFGCRNALIRMKSSLTVRYLGAVSSPQVMKGKKGWLFYAGDEVLENCCYANAPFTTRQLVQWQMSLEEKQEWFTKKGIRFILVIVPNKHTIYAEYLPSWISKVGEKSRLDQFVEHMEANSEVEIVDLRKVLFPAKQRCRLYHRTDTHWNDYGAFIAYQEIMSRLSRWFPGAKPIPESEFILKKEIGLGGDLAMMLGQEHSIEEERWTMKPKFERRGRKVPPSKTLLTLRPWKEDKRPVVFENPFGQINRAVFLGDSMMFSLAPFVLQHFGRLVIAFEEIIDTELIALENPDVVVLEMGERLLVRDRTLREQLN
jgi:hypothetical protein